MTTTQTPDGPQLANDLLERIGRTVGLNTKVSSVFGEPVARDGITVIPVARARFGFGGGAGTGTRESDGSGGGGGGGASVTPIGYIELQDGKARFKRIRNPVDLLALTISATIVTFVLKRLLAGRRDKR